MPLRSDISAGWAELRRVFQRLALKRELRSHAEKRESALQALGERAWEQKVDLSAFADLRGRLEGASARSGELAETGKQLEARKATLDAERKATLESFLARRRAAEELKRPVDASLKAVRDKQAAAKAAAKAEKVAAPVEDPALVAEAARLKGLSDTHAAEIAAILAEERAALARIDGELSSVRTETNAANQQQRAVGVERAGLFRELGRGLYDSGARAGLEEPAQRVRAIDDARAATDARLEGSLAETRALPAGTMTRFWGVVAGSVALVVAVVVAGNMLANRESPQATTASAAGADPEDAKDMTVMRFAHTPKEVTSKERAAAIAILKDDILTMGATADPANLPMFVKLLRSEVPEIRAAAADAIGMVRPSAVETPTLLKLAQDPSEPVANAARRALAASSDPAANEAAVAK